jgi:hypothetical protein
VNHYVVPSGGKVTTKTKGRFENFAVFDTNGEPVSGKPSKLDEVVMRFNDDDGKTAVKRVVGSGEIPTGGDFRSEAISGVSILPNSDPLDVNLTEADFNITNTQMFATFSSEGETTNQSVDMSLSKPNGQPIDTANDSDMYIRAQNVNTGFQKLYNSSSNGSVEEFVIPASPGDRVVVDFVHAFDPDKHNTLYVSQKKSKYITKDILYSESIRGS